MFIQEIFFEIAFILQIPIYALFLPVKCMVMNYCARVLTFSFFMFFLKQRSMITPDWTSLRPLFCFCDSRGRVEHLFGHLEVVILNLKVVDLSTSSSKHTLKTLCAEKHLPTTYKILVNSTLE